jgi:hypothetical protein
MGHVAAMGRSRALAVIALIALLGPLAPVASAQPASTTSAVLRDGNTAASTGDWARVSGLVEPLLHGQLPPADLAEAHRLAGLAAYFQQRTGEADQHFLAYLKLELDARLDPALYPPEVVTFFQDVQTRHAAELRALRPRPRRHFILNLLPPFGQRQNGERTKGYVIAGLLGAFTIGNVTSYLVLRSWCTRVTGSLGESATCDDTKDRSRSANQLRTLNILTGVGLIATYVYGVYDGVAGYRRRSREHLVPFAAPTTSGGVFGLAGSF